MAEHPERFGKYEVLSVIGKGGMGVVYQARDPLIDRIVAIKTIVSGDDESRDDLLKRLTMEARSAGRLQHRNIVTIHDFGVQDYLSYIVMEFVEGTNLGAMIARREPASLDRKLDILVQLCDGVSYAHELGVLHRDLKPSNVAVTSKGVVKVLDFGLARFDSTRLTQAGFLSGTIPYMSPERINGDAGASDDIFAIGAIAYEFLAYQRAFLGRTAPEVMYQVLNKQPLPLSKIAKVPEELDAIVARALEKELGKRFQSVRELGARLADLRKSPALKSFLMAERLVEGISDSTATRRAELDRTVPRAQKAASDGVEQRLRDMTPQRTKIADRAETMATAPMMAEPARQRADAEPPPVAAGGVMEGYEPMPTVIDTPMPQRVEPPRAAAPPLHVAAPEPPGFPATVQENVPASPAPRAHVVPPTISEAAPHPGPSARTTPPTLVSDFVDARGSTIPDPPFLAPVTESAPMDDVVPPPAATRGRLGIFVIAAMVAGVIAFGGFAIYRFVSAPGTPAAANDATAPAALAATVQSQQESLRALRARAAGRSWSTGELNELQLIDEAEAAAAEKLRQNDAAGANQILGASIARLEKLLLTPAAPANPPIATATADSRGQKLATALDDWARTNASIETALDRATRDGVRLDARTSSSLSARKEAVFSLLEDGKFDEFTAQSEQLVASYRDAIRKAGRERDAQSRREGTEVAAAAQPPAPPPPVEQVAVPEPVAPPVEAAQAVPATPLRRVTPKLPQSAIRIPVKGTVVVEVDIDARGEVTDARIVRSLTAQFDIAAVRAAKQWRFNPATVSGRPAPSSMNLEFEFQ